MRILLSKLIIRFIGMGSWCSKDGALNWPHMAWKRQQIRERAESTACKIIKLKISVVSLLFPICQALFGEIIDAVEGVDMSRSYCKCGEKRPWSAWGDCSKSCGTGEQTKTRVCYRRGHFRCRFETEREYTWRQKCNTHACRKYWSISYEPVHN